MSDRPAHGSETKQGPGWWIASDNRWYPPELHPDYVKPGDSDAGAISVGGIDDSTANDGGVGGGAIAAGAAGAAGLAGAAGASAGGLGDKIGSLGDKAGSLGDKAGGLGDKVGGLGDKAGSLGDKAGGLGDKVGGLGDKAGGLGDKAGSLTGKAGDAAGSLGDKAGDVADKANLGAPTLGGDAPDLPTYSSSEATQAFRPDFDRIDAPDSADLPRPSAGLGGPAAPIAPVTPGKPASPGTTSGPMTPPARTGSGPGGSDATTNAVGRSVFDSGSRSGNSAPTTQRPSTNRPAAAAAAATASRPASSPSPTGSFDFGDDDADDGNIPAGSVSIVAGVFSIIASFMVWARDSDVTIEGFNLVRRVAAFDSNGVFTLLLGVALVGFGVLLIFNIKPLWLWSVLIVCCGAGVLAAVVWSYFDITGRASDDWQDFVAASTERSVSDVQNLGVGLRTALGLWVAAIGGAVALLSSFFAKR